MKFIFSPPITPIQYGMAKFYSSGVAVVQIVLPGIVPLVCLVWYGTSIDTRTVNTGTRPVPDQYQKYPK